MKKELKAELKAYFAAPEPVGKEAFIRSIRPPEPENKGMKIFLLQAAYIRKRVWALQAFVFLLGLAGGRKASGDMIWCIAAFMPLLAMAVISECGRSEAYGMAEFELSARFSLKYVILSRICILGTADMLMLLGIIPFLSGEGHSLFRTGVYLLLPYILTSFLGLCIMRFIPGKPGGYVLAAAAFAVSISHGLAHDKFPFIYDDGKFGWWVAALLVLSAGTVMECKKMLGEREELSWSL